MAIIRSRADVSTLSDADLVARVRAGDTDAYGVLWQRHSRAGATVARSYTSSFDPDDLVSESYAKIFQAIRSGGGPNGAFRPYLFTTIRNTAAAWGRARRETTIEDAETIEDPTFSEENSLNALDRSLTATAFRTLPTRWQEALWYSEVESMTPQEIAPLLGMKANAVAALTYRAREGLRQAWIQAHLQSVPADSECRWTIDRLGGYARKSLGKRDTARVDEHLHDCAKCTIVAAEAKDVGSRLALVLLPLAAGVVGATGYAAWMQTGAHVATYAMGAGGAIMPAAAIGGTATVGAAATGVGAGSGAAGGGGAGAGGGAAGGAAAGGAAGAGIGGVLVGASVIGALVIAGVVTAIVLGPTLFSGGKTPTHTTAQTPPSALQSPAPSTTTPTAPVAPPQQPVAAVTSPPPASPPTSLAAPGAPTLSSTTVGGDGTLSARGTGTPGNTITATAASTAPTGASHFARAVVMPPSVTVGSTTVGSDGQWSITADISSLQNGDYALSITQSDLDGLTSTATTTAIRLSIAASAPIITIPKLVLPPAVTTLTSPLNVISGTAKQADGIRVRIDDGAQVSATLTKQGSWTSTIPALPNGPHTITVTAAYKGRTASTTAAITLAVPPAAPVIASPAPDEPITQRDLTVTGTGTPGDHVAVSVPGQIAAVSVTVDVPGRWSASLAFAGIPNGDYTVNATQTDATGVSSATTTQPLRLRIAPDAPVITSVDTGSGAETGRYFPIVTGTADADATVTVTDDSGHSISTLADHTGYWRADQLVGLAPGEHTLTATAVASSDATATPSAPSAPASFALDSGPSSTIADLSFQSAGGSSNATFTIAVTGTDGATVQFVADDTPWQTETLPEANYPSSWVWSGLAPGSEHSLGARYASPDGTRFGAASTMTFTVPHYLGPRAAGTPGPIEQAAPQPTG